MEASRETSASAAADRVPSMIWWVTGGAGFIGTNATAHLLSQGHDVVVIDDLSRQGSELNAAYLKETWGVQVARFDISDPSAWEVLGREKPTPDAIAHLAGQVSLLASIENPRRDFEINALGTLNALEFIRNRTPETALIGMSSNKAYGDLASIRIIEGETRYIAPDFSQGFDESLPLDFHGPYGCSKGTADQYLIDYGRMYGLRTISLRQSSVYGPHQHPRSDQGWVAFLIDQAKTGYPISLNGVGKQVRDLLHASDLARLLELLGRHLPSGGHAVNVGGGPENSLSILELFSWIQDSRGISVDYQTGEPRPSDQLVFISNNSRVQSIVDWRPEIDVNRGLAEVWGD